MVNHVMGPSQRKPGKIRGLVTMMAIAVPKSDPGRRRRPSNDRSPTMGQMWLGWGPGLPREFDQDGTCDCRFDGDLCVVAHEHDTGKRL